MILLAITGRCARNIYLLSNGVNSEIQKGHREVAFYILPERMIAYTSQRPISPATV